MVPAVICLDALVHIYCPMNSKVPFMGLIYVPDFILDKFILLYSCWDKVVSILYDSSTIMSRLAYRLALN